MKLLQACDRPVSISHLVAGIKLIPAESLVRSLSHDRAHMSSGLLPFKGGFQKKKNYKDYK